MNSSCHYCNQDAETATQVIQDELIFCCNGCAVAHQMVQLGELPSESVLEKKTTQYEYLNAVDDLPGLDLMDQGWAKWKISLPAIHCSSCLILLELLPTWLKGVQEVRVQFSEKEATIHFNNEQITRARLAAWLDFIGYPPEVKGKESPKAKNRKRVMELGIAGFAMGNAMMSAFPEYLGLGSDTEAPLVIFFRYSTAIFATASLLIAGRSYLESAYKVLRMKSVNLDVPISVGMLAIWFWSAYQLLTGLGSGYFDSLAGLVFFLLMGKWFQERTYAAFSFERDIDDFLPLAVFSESKGTYTKLANIVEGEELRISPEGVVPVKSTLLSDQAWFDLSFMTGESLPVQKFKGDTLWPGSTALENGANILAAEPYQKDHLQSAWTAEAAGQSQTGYLPTWVSKYFTITVLTIALIGGITWYFIDPSRTVEIAAAVLIIACPCALSLAAPFAYGHGSHLLKDKGLFFKSSYSVSVLGRMKNWIWDKTGTLSEQGHWTAVQNTPAQDINEEDMGRIISMTATSLHPLSKTLNYFYAEELGYAPVPMDQIQEVIGKGITAVDTNGAAWTLGSSHFLTELGVPNIPEVSTTWVGVAVNGVLHYQFNFEGAYRKHMDSVFEKLASTGCAHHLVSGDTPVELPSEWQPYFKDSSHYKQLPAQKKTYVDGLDNTVFLGDGLNDIEALGTADLGIAVVEENLNYFPKCSGVIQSQALTHLPHMAKFSTQLANLVQIAYLVSLLYNVAGVAFALSGALTPVVAAILMPISSITVVALVSFGAYLLASNTLSSNP